MLTMSEQEGVVMCGEGVGLHLKCVCVCVCVCVCAPLQILLICVPANIPSINSTNIY